MLSKATEYAIKAMIFLATKEDRSAYVRIHEIAEAIDSPKPYTSKILNRLRRNGILESTIGAKGGFRIPARSRISLIQIVEAQEGPDSLDRCLLGLKSCSSSRPCPIHDQYKEVKENLLGILHRSFIDDYTSDLNEKQLNLK